MSRTRYCSTCGTLLTEGAVICGECGARYQASPYERRATDAPGAWSTPPRARSRDLGKREQDEEDDEGIELISRESLTPKEPGSTTLRPREQYDQMMVTQPPMNPSGPGASAGQPSGPGSPPPAPAPAWSPDAAGPGPGQGTQMEPPLDGCIPASPLKRLVAVLIDGVIAFLVMIPLVIGIVLLVQDPGAVLPYILLGVGVALPLAYSILMIWLSGAKGFTLGKLIMGLRITRFSAGGGIGFLRALGRWVLYGIIPWLMGLSIFIDPKKILRGFHDRAIDSVVVDVKAGRNPFVPRRDDFERASNDHYLGDPSVAVSAHENLLAEPGAAWHDGSEGPSGQGSDGGWGTDAPAGASPYAPSAPSSSSATDAPISASPWSSAPSAQEPAVPAAQDAGSAWAPPPVQPVAQQSESPQPPAQAQPEPQWGQPPVQSEAQWGQPSAQSRPEPQWGQQPPAASQASWGQDQYAPAPDQPAGQESWGTAPDALQPPAPSYGEQASQEPAPSDGLAAPQPFPERAPQEPEPARSYGDPAQQSPYRAPTPSADPVPAQSADAQGAGPPPTGEPAGAPDELTGDAWGGTDDGVDEQTRLTVPDESIEDLEQTRVSAVPMPPVKRVRLTADDGSDRVVDKAVVIGRNPSSDGQDVLFVLKDETRSVSKTHLRIDGTGQDVVVTDLGSTNGSSVVREDGSRESLVPNSPTVLPSGAQVTLGDRTLSVEREQ
ncbi:RDD family protein [Brachybacterium fresconis]|uniref:RDD family membrane protein YckC n=1 Tax=Brachybacterium fresconis TaxID=173363 RepID=A0ABS4YHM0_9MICO|nr:RDD family protein [Brachybacterium fresconis]MBP2408287.1 putative RDD family membrane protein YckC [Brachybacterium fresconis]